MVEPKKAKLREAQELLAKANADLKEKQDTLQAVIDRVQLLQDTLVTAQNEQKALNDEADLTKNRLVRAGKLTSALADEGVRWTATAETIQIETELLVGDVFIGAACIAYYGAFTGAYRKVLVADWIAGLQEASIPVSPDCSIRQTLASPVEVNTK